MGALMYVVDLANGLGRLGLNLGTNFIILEWMVFLLLLHIMTYIFFIKKLIYFLISILCSLFFHYK